MNDLKTILRNVLARNRQSRWQSLKFKAYLIAKAFGSTRLVLQHDSLGFAALHSDPDNPRVLVYAVCPSSDEAWELRPILGSVLRGRLVCFGQYENAYLLGSYSNRSWIGKRISTLLASHFTTS